MNELTKALVNADETFLTSLANKGIYKRALKDTDGAELVSNTENGCTVVETGGETVKIKTPLGESSCSCVSRTICRHIVGAIILLRNNLTEEDFSEAALHQETEMPAEESAPVQVRKGQDSPEKSDLTEKERKKINTCAIECLDVLGSILQRGLVRIPETAPENLEIAAVQCHSVKMADAERALRELGGRLSDCLARRASFSTEVFSEKFCQCINMLEILAEDDINAGNLGVFKQKYTEYKGNLTILPIGQRHIAGGEYEGEIFYFLNMDENAENRFMSLSDIHPVFYESSAGRKFRSSLMPWGMSSSVSKMMKKKMVLGKAKVSGGKLSSSQETSLLMSSQANPGCDEVRNLICTDFRQIVVELDRKNPRNELDRLFFVSPARCISSRFDKYSQTYIMTVEDTEKNRINVRAKYRSENKDFISLLEEIGKKMLEKPEKIYTLLASAYIENGELNLFPIEIYDFIYPYHEEYELPEEYENSGENSEFSGIILNLLEEIKGRIEIVIQCGLHSGINPEHRLESLAFNYGLKNLSSMTGKFMEDVSAYRHRTENDCKYILHEMSELYRYISAAQKKLEIISALSKMTDYK